MSSTYRAIAAALTIAAAACGAADRVATPAHESDDNDQGANGGDTEGTTPRGDADTAAPALRAPADPGPSSTTQPAPSPAVVTSETLEVMGATRSFVLVVPPGYTTAQTYALVLALHGDSGDGPGMRAALRLDEHTGSKAIVAYPSGKGASWDLYSAAAQNQDAAFIAALVDSLRGRFAIDRVFATGFSSGAFMVNQLACRSPALFRGIAAHSGGAPQEPQDPSATRWPNGFVQCANQTTGVAAMVVHGTEDGIVAYESGEFAAEYWAYVNGCASSRAGAAPPPCLRHLACPADKPVLFCAIAGLGHTFWAQAAAADWSFFSSL